MRTLLLVIIATLAGTAVGLMVLIARDWVREWRLVRRMRRSGAAKRLAQTQAAGVTWVVDDEGNVIDGAGNSWIVTG